MEYEYKPMRPGKGWTLVTNIEGIGQLWLSEGDNPRDCILYHWIDMRRPDLPNAPCYWDQVWCGSLDHVLRTAVIVNAFEKEPRR